MCARSKRFDNIEVDLGGGLLSGPYNLYHSGPSLLQRDPHLAKVSQPGTSPMANKNTGREVENVDRKPIFHITALGLVKETEREIER